MFPQLNENEMVVYEVLSEFLKSKRAISLEKVIPYLNKNIRKSTLDPKKIREVLDELINKNVIVEGSQLTKDDLFKIPKREKIFHYIVNNPGTYAYHISRDLKFSSHVVLWHLKILNDFELIKAAEIDNHLIYFDSKIDSFEAKRQYYMRKKKCKQLINLIKNQDDGITKTSISKTINMHLNTVNKYLEALQEFGLLHKVDSENKAIYHYRKLIEK